jgi:prepilin-type N-terminal cleavage/methylation domain-containing protein
MNESSGFTLIEVLLAMVILGVGFAVILTGVSQCLAVMKSARKYQDAQWILDLGTMEHPMISGEDPEEMAVDPVEYPDGYTFEREVEEDEDEDGLYVVRSRVTWSERGRHGKEETVRYVLYMEKK